MEQFSSVAKMKEAFQRGQARWKTFQKDSEKAISRGMQVIETTAACGAWGYANGRWGEAPPHDASGLTEIRLLGMPADAVTGLALIGVSFFGGFGKYDEHGLNVGTGSASAFTFRLGYEMGSKAAHETAPRKTSPQKAPPMVAGRGPNGGRVHTVWQDEGAPV
jgi:hypothetical protein